MKYIASMSVQTKIAFKVSDFIKQNEIELLFPYPHKLLYECFQTFLTIQPKETPLLQSFRRTQTCMDKAETFQTTAFSILTKKFNFMITKLTQNHVTAKNARRTLAFP